MKIALLGDIALFGCNTVKNHNYTKRLTHIKGVLDKCDYVIGNLETPLTTSDKTVGGKSAYIKGLPENVDILKYLNITHVGLANNHAFDYGQRGLTETINTLDKAGINWYGVNGKQCRIDVCDNSIALLGYCCYSTNGKGMGVVNILDPLLIEKEINELDEVLPIVSMHWGQEHVHYPNYDHLKLARKLCKNRDLVIHGHHPHVIQGIEKLGKSIVAYSFGNFCFDDIYTSKSKDPLVRLSKDNKESIVMILNIQSNNVVDYKIIPFCFNESEYIIDEEIIDKIERWSDFLQTPQNEYITKRNEDISQYINSRRKLRNVQWYLKRMSIESIKMILGAKTNLKKYNALIHNYIE